MAMKPQPRQVARVRSRRYMVEQVVDPPNPGDQTLVRLSCLEDDAPGVPLEVLWETELDAVVLEPASWDIVARRGFDPPDRFAGYLNALRWNCVTATDPTLFQAPYRAGIQVKAYQLEPLRKALQLPRVNLFIADDVGLGKTIEAGLILRELMMRQKVQRVVVAAPPSVVLQWRDELEQRFGMSFVVYNRDYVAAKRAERGFGVNPWSTHSRFIISHALLRSADHARSLTDWLGESQPCPGSLLILDEAHNAAPASGSRYAVDSNLTVAIRELAPRFEHRLFLSATPHNGHSNSFAALLELLDPQRFCRGVPVVDPAVRDAVLVRRLKEDLRQLGTGFPKRLPARVDIRGLPADAPELKLAELLDQYRAAREERMQGLTKRQQRAAGLIMVTLQKRLLSSVEAFYRTLAVHRETVRTELSRAAADAGPTAEQLALLRQAPGSDDDAGELDDETLGQREDEAARAATLASRGAAGSQELSLLDEMFQIASATRHLPDARIRHLVQWIREHQCPAVAIPGGGATAGTSTAWSDVRVLVFTEYLDTKRYLEQQLSAAIEGTDRADQRIDCFTGGMGDDRREAIKRAFNSPPAQHPLRILIANDAAREGVNLQNHCADLFHFDLPWNPARLEQRNGRIDRTLQRAAEVRCHYFVYEQRPEDKVLAALARKSITIEKELGSLTPVLERRVERLLDEGIRRSRVDEKAAEVEADHLSPEERQVVSDEFACVTPRGKELATQLGELEDLLKKSKDFLCFEAESFRGVLSSALGMMGAPALEPVPGALGRWRFPDIQAFEHDPSWTATLDSLRMPDHSGRDGGRRERPLRPIVFSDPGSLDEDVVHLHLEHRLAQRLMNRFLAQGFVLDDLSRACVGQVDDAIPRVVLLGRLSLHGSQAARLHDEVMSVAARWVEPPGRKGGLQPMDEAGRREALSLLEHSIVDPARRKVPAAAQKHLQQFAALDVGELLPHLAQQSKSQIEQAVVRLRERGKAEAEAMRRILRAQRKRIEDRLKEVETNQLEFAFDSESERRQLESDRRHWRRRVAEIDQELESEPKRIREGYEVSVSRFEPVGIVYLWPTSR